MEIRILHPSACHRGLRCIEIPFVTFEWRVESGFRDVALTLPHIPRCIRFTLAANIQNWILFLTNLTRLSLFVQNNFVPFYRRPDAMGCALLCAACSYAAIAAASAVGP